LKGGKWKESRGRGGISYEVGGEGWGGKEKGQQEASKRTRQSVKPNNTGNGKKVKQGEVQQTKKRRKARNV